MSFGVGAALYLTGEKFTLRLCSRSSAAPPKLWCSVFSGKLCLAYCTTPCDTRTQDFKFPGCRDGACASFAKGSADSKTSFLVTGLISTDRSALLVILNFENSLALRILCIKGVVTAYIHIKFGEKEVSNVHRSGKFCLFGSLVNQRFAFRSEFQRRAFDMFRSYVCT